jgi:hypothetical protein
MSGPRGLSLAGVEVVSYPSFAPPQRLCHFLDSVGGPIKGMFDNAELEIPCPQCGEKIKKTVGGIKDEPKFRCPINGCDGWIDAGEFVRGLNESGDELDDFGKNFGGTIDI